MTTEENDYETSEKDGAPWTVLGICLGLVILLGINLLQNFSFITLALMLLPMAYAYYAIEILEPNEIGGYILREKITGEFTTQGGIKAKIPFLERIAKFEVGMFVMEVEYNNLTLNRGDNVSGKVLLTLDISKKYFNILYGITDGNFNREVIKQKTLEKFKESVPAKMATALERYSNIHGINSIDEGKEFEKIVKKEEFAKILQKVLARYDETQEEGYRWNDCFGLELKKVEIPTPTITGGLYETYRKKEESKEAKPLATEKAKGFGMYFKQYVTDYKKLTKDLNPEKETLSKLRDEAIKLYQQQEGADVRYYDGLSGSNIMV